MASFRERRALRAASWLGFVAIGCVYPHLSSSPDWKDEDAAGGEPTQAGSSGRGGGGGSGSGAKGGSAPNDGGAGAAAPLGGEGGAPPAIEDVIRGVVLDQFDRPVSGVVVLIDDVELVSDADGVVALVDSGKQSFTATLVDQKNRIAFVYEGVTRRELRFNLAALPEDDWHTAKVSGTAETSLNAYNLRVAYDDRARSFSQLGMRNAADMSPSVRYDLSAVWSGWDTMDGQLSAMNFVGSPAQNMPESYEFASMPLALAAGDLKKNVDLELTPLATRELSVEANLLAGVTRYDVLLLGSFAFSNAAPTSDQKYLIPDDPVFDAAKLPSYLTIACSSPEGSFSVIVPLTAKMGNLQEDCRAPARLVSPEANATDVTNDTPLVFEPELDGCHSFNLVHDVSKGGWSVLIQTMNSEVVAPDLSKYGLSFTPHDVSWTAGTTSPCEGIDSYLAPIDRDAPATPLSYVLRSDRSSSAAFSTAN